jgi:hypothetical protein
MILQPVPEDVWQLGYSWRATNGSTAAPGAISVTWTEVRSREEAEELEAGGRCTDAPSNAEALSQKALLRRGGQQSNDRLCT